jgi:dolichol-phosphate mannosyltransferase
MTCFDKNFLGLSIILPVNADAENLRKFILKLKNTLIPKVKNLEVLIVDRFACDGIRVLADTHGCTYIVSSMSGFGDALIRGFEKAKYELIVTMDDDCSHDPLFVLWMVPEMENADMVIASRFVPRGGQEVGKFRSILSRSLNRWLAFICSMPLKDLSGGFKIYRKSMIGELDIQCSGFEIQSEITIKAYGHGYRIKEIPFFYRPRPGKRRQGDVLRYGWSFLASSLKLRTYRNSIEFCDYDERAFSSRIPMQQIWQQTRYARVISLQRPTGICLDIGCGTGRLIVQYPEIVGLDINFKVLRYLAHEPRKLVQSKADCLPFADGVFDTLFCCEAAEHLPQDCGLFSEISRILKPGGSAVITTPDYGTPIWPMIEWLYTLLVPHAYGHTHISKYNRDTLTQILAQHDLERVEWTRIFGSILIMRFKKAPEPQ